MFWMLLFPNQNTDLLDEKPSMVETNADRNEGNKDTREGKARLNEAGSHFFP